jgi:2-succinyl-6-hydroxy-2,4-cyclohexadiene-1-carboxylate synthase
MVTTGPESTGPATAGRFVAAGCTRWPPLRSRRVLHAETTGDGPRLVLVHGFTQTGRSWGRFGELLEPGRQVVRVDLPGHGGSGQVRADLSRSGDLVAEAAAAAGDGNGSFDLLGYSLGARVALHAALSHPSAVRRLVLVGGTAGIEDEEARAGRRRRDDAMAQALEDDGDAEPFLRRWLASPMFAGLRDAGMDERRRNGAVGLASSLRLAGTGTQAPLWDRLGTVAVPTLLMAGADDIRFAVAAARMARALPDAAFSLVPGAGHAAHLAQPELAARIVARFLDG